MAITKQKKEEILKDLKDKFSSVKIIVFVDYSGLDTKSLEDVRNGMRNEGVDFKVVKKTLLNLAIKDRGIKGDIDSLEGQIAATFGYEDEASAAKVAYRFSQTYENFKILLGILDDEFVDVDKIVALAELPSREALLARYVGSIRAPISGLVNVMEGNIRGFVQVLNAISQK